MADEDNNEKYSRTMCLMMLMCQSLGVSTFVSLPREAIHHGATGFIIGYTIVFLFIGMPLLYMEFIVGQFTARDCIEVWKVRSCLSHIGYVHVIWQVLFMIYNHIMASFMLHYFLISFEDPIPFYACGAWSTQDCKILSTNYTINIDCIKFKHFEYKHCQNLYMTFPEYQYWRYYILSEKISGYSVAWQVCLASSFVCIVLYLSCFKKKKSAKWVLLFAWVYSLAGYFLLMIGSMMQKGVIRLYTQALDSSFQIFSEKYRIADIVIQVTYALNLGTGISFNLSSFSGFRAPCYSNIVITVVVCGMFTVFAVCTVAMMTCPYAYEYSVAPGEIMELPMTLSFEKLPRMIKQYENSSFWLVVNYSSNVVMSISTNIVVTLCLLEIFAARYKIIYKYPGMTCFFGSLLMFLVSLTLLGNSGVYVVFTFNRIIHLVTVFLTIIECVVFVIWYGLDKFCEDVHFMQGIQPKNYMKMAWLCSTVIISYAFISETVYLSSIGHLGLAEDIGWILLFLTLGLIILGIIVKLLIATCKGQFKESVKLDPMWGPKSDLLLRSRAMFTAQAMTKEYIYRQYHLQAGILERQRISNVRREEANTHRPTLH